MKVQYAERMSRLLLALVALAAVALCLIGPGVGPARAMTGDNLSSFDATATAGIPACASGVGTGIAFDGVRLYLSCSGSNVLERVIASGTHASAGPISVTGMTSIDALAYDGTAGGGKIWACHNFSDVYLITLSPLPPLLPTTATGTFKFSTSNGCRDGLAFDGTNTTLWASGDESDSIQHYSLGPPNGPTGTLMASFSGLVAKLGGLHGNSGIAVGGSTLYLANDGGEQIYQCDKGLVTCTLMSTFPGHRIEDLECDNVTFPGKSAIWSQDAYDRILNAWEIPAGTCAFGGGGPPVGGTVALSVTEGGSPFSSFPLSASATAALAVLAAGVSLFILRKGVRHDHQR
jgi:hypothetical protein